MRSSWPDHLVGRRALITGASAGLGQELASALAARGVSLVLVARRWDRLDAFARQLSAQNGVDVQVEGLDLRDAGAAQAIWDRTEGSGRPVDILVNNAGAAVPGDFVTNNWQCHENVLQLQIAVVTQLTWMFAGQMVRRGYGYVMNVASIAADAPCPSLAVYAASKAYVRSYTEALACELRGTGVTAVSLCPGPIDTELFERGGMALTAVGRMFCATPHAVARRAVSAIARRRTSVAVGLSGRVLTAPLGLLPRAWRARVVGRALRVGLREAKPTVSVPGGPPSPWLASKLDMLIDRSHRIEVFGRRYHPFLLMADIALGLALVLAAIVMFVEQLPPGRFAIVIAAVVLGYPYYLRLKLLVSGTRA